MSAESVQCISCKEYKNTYNIFETHTCEDKEEEYSKMLEECFSIEIEKESGVTAMCEKCIMKLRDAFYFRQNFIINIKDLICQKFPDIEILGAKNLVKDVTIDPKCDLLKDEVAENSKKIVVLEEKPIDNKLAISLFNKNYARCKYVKLDSVLKKEKLNEINKENMLTPKQSQKPTAAAPLTQTKIMPGQTMCHICYLQFNSGTSLREHMKMHNTFNCSTCEKDFNTSSGLEQHMMSHRKGIFICNVCHKFFRKENTLNSHMWRIHRSTRTFKCSVCSKKFATFHMRLNHLKKDHGMTDPKYPCPYCDRKYFYSGSRATHIRLTHLRDRRYRCRHCKMVFSVATALRNHMATKHGIGEKKHECNKCRKKFFRKSTLNHHLKIHERRGWKCSYCDASFTYKALLKHHLELHEKDQQKSVVIENVTEESDDAIYINL